MPGRLGKSGVRKLRVVLLGSGEHDGFLRIVGRHREVRGTMQAGVESGKPVRYSRSEGHVRCKLGDFGSVRVLRMCKKREELGIL